jgi:anti-sigma factor RsiW
MHQPASEPGSVGCAAPIDDLCLLAALDGQADAGVLEHLQSCPSCHARAQSFAALERTLRDRLFRSMCPPTTELLAFQQRILGPQRYVIVAEHMRDCPYCAHEIQLLEQASAAPRALIEPRVPRLVLQLYAPRTPFPTPVAFSTTRSLSQSAHYVYRAANVQLTVSVAQALGRPGFVMLSGMLLIGYDLFDAVSNATASLLRNGQVMASVPIDSSGCFTLDDIPAGEHVLSLRLPDTEIVVETLVL